MSPQVIFIDTENTFRPDRLRAIADRYNLEQDAVLENVLYTRAFTSEHQFEILDHVAAQFHEEPGIFKLLIVDSIMALFRVDFSGRGELADRQQRLAQYLSRLQKISEEYNVSIYISNQMTADPGATMSFQADPKKPIGGHILAHASTTRVSLRKGRGETRIAKIYDSPELPENEATFAITPGGIADAKEWDCSLLTNDDFLRNFYCPFCFTVSNWTRMEFWRAEDHPPCESGVDLFLICNLDCILHFAEIKKYYSGNVYYTSEHTNPCMKKE